MKTYAPKGLWGGDLRGLLEDLQCTQVEACKYLQVSERTFRRWLAEDSAPYAVLAALWHETPRGREAAHLDTGNALNIQRGLARANGEALQKENGRLARVLQIADTGAANDPLMDGPTPYRSPVRYGPYGLSARPCPPELPHIPPPEAPGFEVG